MNTSPLPCAAGDILVPIDAEPRPPESVSPRSGIRPLISCKRTDAAIAEPIVLRRFDDQCWHPRKPLTKTELLVAVFEFVGAVASLAKQKLLQRCPTYPCAGAW